MRRGWNAFQFLRSLPTDRLACGAGPVRNFTVKMEYSDVVCLPKEHQGEVNSYGVRGIPKQATMPKADYLKVNTERSVPCVACWSMITNRLG